MVSEDVLGLGPSVEGQPVVGPDDENELSVGIIGSKMFERVPSIRRLGEVELVVGSRETRLILERLSGEFETQVVGNEIVVGRFEGVEWGDDKPNFIECGLLQNLLCQGDVTGVDGVEAAAKDACTLLRTRRVGMKGMGDVRFGGHISQS